jgi:hypothetical protein
MGRYLALACLTAPGDARRRQARRSELDRRFDGQPPRGSDIFGLGTWTGLTKSTGLTVVSAQRRLAIEATYQL